MTLDALIMLAGALVAVLPFLGFPESWNTAFFFLLGVFILALGVVVRRRGNALSDEYVQQPAPLAPPPLHSEPESPHSGQTTPSPVTAIEPPALVPTHSPRRHTPHHPTPRMRVKKTFVETAPTDISAFDDQIGTAG